MAKAATFLLCLEAAGQLCYRHQILSQSFWNHQVASELVSDDL